MTDPAGQFDSVRITVAAVSLYDDRTIPAGMEGAVLEARPDGTCLVEVAFTPQTPGHDGDFAVVRVTAGQYEITSRWTSNPEADGRRLPLTERQARLLAVVAEGGGDWDARRIDLTVNSRYGPGEGTVLQELQELQQLGLAVRDDSRSGAGGRWTVTSTARPFIR